MNPFKYGCVVCGENFCRRGEAERQLRRFAESGQNVVVQGPRRMGKSSLVKKAISDMHGMNLVYIDLYYIGSLSDLCKRVMAGIAGMNSKMSFIRKVMSLVSHLRPTLSFSTTDGSPIISVDARAADDPNSLQTVMELLEKIASGGKTCIVFDEFQDILRIPDADRVMAEMRGAIQFQPDIPYFFLGSVRHDMMAIFSSPKSPFFKSAAAFEVDTIPRKDFVAFIGRRFAKGKRKIADETASRLIDVADSVSGDVQELCAALWETTNDGATITEGDVPLALEHIFARERKGFEKSIARLTPTQIAVLKGLAATDEAKIYSSQFLDSIRIASTGTVKKAVKRLAADELVYEWNHTWRFVDPFFREWVNRKI
ncbi:MAG: hypothetical protein IKF72_14045 [Kiritimatiellae bacterium]|nr:hypothetical protein [Kiritimatiellia bacterium]